MTAFKKCLFAVALGFAFAPLISPHAQRHDYIDPPSSRAPNYHAVFEVHYGLVAYWNYYPDSTKELDFSTRSERTSFQGSLRFMGASVLDNSQGWKRLEKLDLSNNRLTELRLNSEMTSLQELKVSGNQPKKLTLPKGLRNLRILRLSGNQLVSLTLPSDMTGLKELWVGGNPIEEIDVPRGLDLSGLVLKGFDKADVTVEGVLPPQPEPPKEPITPIPPVSPPKPTPPLAPCDVQFILQSAPSIYGPWSPVQVTIQITDGHICLPNNGQRARFFRLVPATNN